VRTPRNRILALLPSSDRALLQPHLERVELPVRRPLEVRNTRIEHAYFLDDGIASVVANGANDASIEVGLIGSEGMTGLAVIMGGERAAHSTFMQVAGRGHQIPVEALRQAIEQSAQLLRTFLRFAYAFFIQTTYTALTNGRCKVEERLARWLLMAHDRIKGDELPLTHEFLAIMLGVRRAGVTTALKTLVDRGLIKSR
jgi:CRP-like cAMP-binding protein